MEYHLLKLEKLELFYIILNVSDAVIMPIILESFETKIHFVNPEVWERERGYSEMLAGEYATTGDISANH